MQWRVIVAGRELPHDIGHIKLQVWQVPGQHMVWHLCQPASQDQKVSVGDVYPSKELLGSHHLLQGDMQAVPVGRRGGEASLEGVRWWRLTHE